MNIHSNDNQSTFVSLKDSLTVISMKNSELYLNDIDGYALITTHHP